MTSGVRLPSTSGHLNAGPTGLGVSALRIGVPRTQTHQYTDTGAALQSIARLLGETLDLAAGLPPTARSVGGVSPMSAWLPGPPDRALIGGKNSTGSLPDPLAPAAAASRLRLLGHLIGQIDADGVLRDECGSRILESALFLLLLRKEDILPQVQEGITDYLRCAAPDEALSAIIAGAALGYGDPSWASAYLASFEHGTGTRKSLLIRALFALFDLVSFDTPWGLPDIPYHGFAAWTELSLCAIKILRAHACQRDDLATDTDRAYLASRLADSAPSGVFEGNVLAHLIGLHALQTYRPADAQLREGIAAVLPHQRSDDGIPFVTGQDVFVTALAGMALAGSGTDHRPLVQMAERVAGWQLGDGGWGYSTDTTQTDVDDTARCVEFLLAVDPKRYRDALSKAEDYLVRMAGTDGGFPTYLRGEPSDVHLTACAVMAMSPWWDRHPELLNAAIDYLLGQQRPDGTYPRAWTTSGPSVIAHVLEALHRAPSPAATLVPRIERATHDAMLHLYSVHTTDGGWGQRDGRTSDVLSTAQALPALAKYGIPRYLYRGLQYLVERQHADGGFTSIPDQVGPRPLPYDFPVLADIHVLNAYNSVLPPIESPHATREPVAIATDLPQLVEPITIPAFYCPIEPAIHPAAEEIDARTVEWMYRFSLGANDAHRERLARCLCGPGAARACPDAREELVQILSDYYMWVFAFDDEYCDEGPLGRLPGELASVEYRIQRVAEVTEHPIDENDRYGLALRDLRIRLDELVSPSAGADFMDLMRGYFLAEATKAGFVARGRRPGVDDYTAIRFYSGGVMNVVSLVAVLNGVDMPPDLPEDRRVRAITEAAAIVGAGWGPDIFSYAKDRLRTGDGFNLVDAIRHDQGGAEEEAINEAMAMWERAMLLFLRMRDHLVAERIPELTRYVTGLGQFIRGSMDWSFEVDRFRYRDGLGGDEIVRSSGYRDTPSQDNREPLPIRSITWWWKHDPGD